MLALVSDHADRQLGGCVTFLQESGCDVIVVEGTEATISEANHAAPDLVLMRAREPLPETLDLCRRLRSGDQTRHIAIIVLTDNDDAYVRDRIIGAGATMIVRTPVAYPALLVRVRRLLAAKRQAHQRHSSRSLET